MTLNDVQEKTLLIAEEDDDLCNCLALFFSDKFNVKIVKNSTSIQDDLHLADFLLIDASIVDNTGIEFLRSIKKTCPQTLVVIMQSIITKDSKEYAFYKNYSDAIVYKPCDVNHIFQVISQLTE